MSQKTARIVLDTDRVISEISPLLFGGFAEHMGRCVYEGIYDPASPLADEDGLRSDVRAALERSATPPSATPAATSSLATAGWTA